MALGPHVDYPHEWAVMPFGMTDSGPADERIGGSDMRVLVTGGAGFIGSH